MRKLMMELRTRWKSVGDKWKTGLQND